MGDAGPIVARRKASIAGASPQMIQRRVSASDIALTRLPSEAPGGRASPAPAAGAAAPAAGKDPDKFKVRRSSTFGGQKLGAEQGKAALASSSKLVPGGKNVPQPLPAEPEKKPVKKEEEAVINVDPLALTLSRRHKLEFHEVKYMLRKFLEAPKQTNGGCVKSAFRKILLLIFDRQEIDPLMVDSAYLSCNAEMGQPDMDKFLSWYKQHMFTSVAAMTADSSRQASDAMVYELAKKHQITAVEMDLIKQHFDRFDTDGSGNIEQDEFRIMIKSLLRVSADSDISETRLMRFWTEIDADGSGEVNFEEFTEWYLKYFSRGAGGQGPVKAFYDSFNPQEQRRKSINVAADALAKLAEQAEQDPGSGSESESDSEGEDST